VSRRLTSPLEDKKSRVSATDSPPSGTGTTSPGDGPVVNQLDEAARDTFPTGRPLEDSADMSVCKHCKKSVLNRALKSHMDACLAQKNKKKEKATAKEKAKLEKEKDKEKEKGLSKSKEKKVAVGDEDGEGEEDDDAEGDEDLPKKAVGTGTGGIKAAKKSAGKKTDAAADGEKKGKKRKADGDAEKAPKAKKKKEEPKPKAPKPKGPVDVERQCGVITPNGVPCARSLTCKSHSMGAKRAVPGRSLPYDMLLAAYQKKNQAKQQSMWSFYNHYLQC
jgi:SAGA-associated factor 73